MTIISLAKDNCSITAPKVRFGPGLCFYPEFRGAVQSLEKDWGQALVRSSGSEFGERIWPKSGLAGSEIGERNGPKLGLAGSEFGKRNGPNPGLAGSEFGEKTGLNPGLAGS